MSISKFALYAAENSSCNFLGTLIKFNRGEWQMGKGKDLVSPDKRFVAVMDTATTGHIKWLGGKQVDSKMGLITDDFRPVHRNQLDDFDRATWEIAKNGDRIDPWQITTLLVLASPAAPHDLYTFTTNTKGGEGAIAVLCGAHGATTEKVGQYPVVTLDSDSYQHKEKTIGRVIFPVFEIVDCVEAAPFNALERDLVRLKHILRW